MAKAALQTRFLSIGSTLPKPPQPQTWLQFTLACGYITPQQQTELHQEYNHIIG